MNNSNSDLEIELKRAEIAAVRAEEKLTLSEIENRKIEQKILNLDHDHKVEGTSERNWAELIKVLGAVILGAGGLVAAYHQHELAEAKVLLAELKTESAESSLEQTGIAIEAAKEELNAVIVQKERAIEDQRKAEENKLQIEKTLTDYKSELSRLTAEARAKEPSLVANELVYIQFQGNITRARINDLRKNINSNGFNSPGAERLEGEYANIVKYFSDTDANVAQSLAESTEVYFQENNCPLSIRLVPVSLPDNRASPIEMWLNHSCE